MADENTTQEQAGTPPVETQTQDEDKSRNGEWAKGLFKKIADLESKLSAEQEAKAQKEREAEEARLKAAGDFETLSKKLQAEREAEKTAFAQRERELSLRAGLAGIKDDLLLKGAMANCPADMSPDDYVKDLKEKRPDLWENTSFQMSTTLPNGARQNQGEIGINWAAVKKDYNSNNPQLTIAAVKKVEIYRQQNGKNPPGFE